VRFCIPKIQISMTKDSSKVTVMGLGLNGGGVGTALYFLRRGYQVVVTDLKSEEQLQDSVNILQKEFGTSSNLSLVLGEHRQQDFSDTDLVIRNPAVTLKNEFIKIALDSGVRIQTELEVFWQETKKIIKNGQDVVLVGVTGTRGKSTTATLIYEFLKRDYEQVFLVGNIGKSYLEILPDLEQNGGKVVMELSSFQLEGLKYSPNIAVVTNLFEDHIDYHGSLARYIDAKKNIVRHQTPNDVAVLNYDNLLVRAFATEAKGRIEYFSTSSQDFYIRSSDQKIYWGTSGEMLWSEIRLAGEHNRANIITALTAVKDFEAVTDESIKDVLGKFGGLFGRQQIIGTKKDLTWVNDTTSTMPEALCAALDSFGDKSLHLIVGGNDKGLSYDKVANHIGSKLKSVFLLRGTATDKLKSVFGDKLLEDKQILLQEVSSLDESVKEVLKVWQVGDWVLFSPGATSFGSFANEFERGRAFEKIIDTL
jgi:UDP-N-acetylmuramoylalanine--D-glutamate ligase